MINYFCLFDCQAFSIPVIQIVYETLKDQQEGKKGRAAIKTGGAGESVFINGLFTKKKLSLCAVQRFDSLL